MISNYFMIAWRQILKNKLYASINILGLVVGLAIYIFGSLLVSYERNYDTFYENSDRVYTVGTRFGPSANIGVSESDGIYTGFTPFLRVEIEEVEAVARTVGAEYLISVNDNHFYEKIRFADSSLLQIFDFEYIEGDNRALEDPTGILLSASAATKLFGTTSALGQVVTLDHDVSLHVTAVIQDLPQNTHLGSSLISSTKLDVVASLEVLNSATGYPLEGTFNNLSSGDRTYLLLPSDTNRGWLQAKVDAVFESHYPEESREFVAGLNVRPLVEANTFIWDAVGLPVLDSVRILALLVLVVAIVNYTNLATAQSLSRAREIGLRKTMGAGRRQLVAQFMVESLCVTMIAMAVAMALLEIVVPLFKDVTGRALTMDYANTLPWLVTTTLLVGLVAGAYPAYLITKAAPIDVLRDGAGRGVKGSRFRSLMLGLQFSITIFMLAMVLVVFYQNQKIEESAEIYPKSQIVTLKRLEVEAIQQRLETLKNELASVPGISQVSYSSQVPYLQNNSSMRASRVKGDIDGSFLINEVAVDQDFFTTYDIPIVLGRGLSRANSADTVKKDVLAANIVINELSAARLGFSSATEALNQVFYEERGEREPRAYTIVGVLPDQNFLGFHNQIKPMAFHISPFAYRIASIKMEGVAMGEALGQIEAIWEELIPDYPIQIEFLDETFNQMYQVYSGTMLVLGIFASVALVLSMIGLFGLAAFMAESRTKEIGVRKVMGANVYQIVRLLIWQFSRPVMWALLVAVPLAYFAADAYLTFFADRISLTGLIVVGAGLLSVLFAWAVVAIHAMRVAQSNPVHALRYE
jgi:putative ABC transport system permease protein